MSPEKVCFESLFEVGQGVAWGGCYRGRRQQHQRHGHRCDVLTVLRRLASAGHLRAEASCGGMVMKEVVDLRLLVVVL